MTALILFYIVFVAISYWIFKNAYTIWKINYDFTLPICTLIIYYFTLGGAIFFPIDSFVGFKGVAIGLHYTPMFEKLFVVNFDTDYMLACGYYAIFILVFQYSYLYIIRKSIKKNQINFQQEIAVPFKLEINPYIVLFISFSLILTSFFILRKEIFYAIANEKSIYLITRATKSPYYTIHQLANEFSILIPFIAYTFTILTADNKIANIVNKKNTVSLLILACFVSSLYISMLGNRREILSGIVICTLISLNQFKHINYRRFALIFIMVLTFFLSNTFFRSTIISSKLNDILHLESTEIVLKSDEEFNTKGIAGSVLFSNELFYAHFSMYGALHKQVPLTYGSSLVYLASSIVPRAIYPNRPPDIYTYYASAVNAVPGQIYTLHHATAWYLNFGFIGIIIGSLILAIIFAFAFHINHSTFKNNKTYFVLFKILLPFLLCSQMVTFITAGPEAYKSLLLEGVIIPIILLSLCFKKEIKLG